jgi:hypothetical protein
MTTMTLRGIDDVLAETLKEQARQKGVSLNTLALQLIRKAAGLDKPKRLTLYNDLDSLAGTWSAESEAEFHAVTSSLSSIDKDLWQ